MELETLLGIDKTGFVAMVQYLFVALPIFASIFYASTINSLKKHCKTDKNVSTLLRRELFEDKNLALSIVLAGKLISIAMIVSTAMVFNLIGLVIFAVLAYLIQFFTVKGFELFLNIKDFMESTIEEQNIPAAVLYA